MLFIVDDVWTPRDVQAFQIRSTGCAVVYTSRRRAGFDDRDVPVENVELLTEGEAEDLFRMHAKLADDAPFDEATRKILGHCNRHALAIVVAGSMLALHPGRGQLILRRFEAAKVQEIVASVPDFRRSESFPKQETSIFQIIKVSYDFLGEIEQAFLKRLAIYPEDTRIPLAAIEMLGNASGLDELQCEQTVLRLEDAALLTFHRESRSQSQSYVTLHDLQRDFVTCLNENPAVDHRTLMQYVKARFGGRLFGEGVAPGGDYFRQFLVHHLVGAEMKYELFELLVDPDWIAHRLMAKDQVFDLIADYDRALGQGVGA